ncbi:GxxExxY protein [Ramlibacter sp.]|uniref:GxxExxY protein n=1 Tax=Ramlibacter sp. TaxID=1917967 RepID=UPI003D099203
MYEHDPLTEQIIQAGIEVHRALGPGLLETVYEEALRIELRNHGLPCQRQIGVPVTYRGHLIGEYRPDLVVAETVVVEVKSVERLDPVHRAQLLAYLRVTKIRVGLLMNFNAAVLKDGLKRLAL